MRVLAAHENARLRDRLQRLGAGFRICELSVTSSSAEVAESLTADSHDLVLLSGNIAAGDARDTARLIARAQPCTVVVGSDARRGVDLNTALRALPTRGLDRGGDESLIDELAQILYIFSGDMAPRPLSRQPGRKSRRGTGGTQDVRTVGRTDGPADDGLTKAEIDVLAGVARGSTMAGLADRLELPEETIDEHVTSILEKLHRRYARPVRP
jgi:DNA-binding NarL/FixJ family response regulator